MRPSKGEMLVRLERLEGDREIMSSRISELRRCLSRQEQLLDKVAELQGYRVVHKEGYYLEPIKEEPYGN